MPPGEIHRQRHWRWRWRWRSAALALAQPPGEIHRHWREGRGKCGRLVAFQAQIATSTAQQLENKIGEVGAMGECAGGAMGEVGARGESWRGRGEGRVWAR